jgi:hypothetical protein
MIASWRGAATALLSTSLTCAMLAACGSNNATALDGCATVVRGMVSGPATLTARWLPSGFRHGHNASYKAALPSMMYTSQGHDGARIELSVELHSAALHPADAAGRSVVRPVIIDGKPGFVGTGKPDPRFIGVYWKLAGRYLLSVIGYKVSEREVLRVARHTRFTPPVTTSLPVDPGTVVTRNAAVAAARRSANGGSRVAGAKLTSWTEAATMLAAHTGRIAPSAPDPLGARPWRPVWAVLLSAVADDPSLVVIDGATGDAVTALGAGQPGWYSALTDRAGAGCPGGSTARLPFGVLTRDEARYAAGVGLAHWPPGVKGSTRVVLSTVPEVNKADPGLYGGCIQQNCWITELVWVTITTKRGIGGHRLRCLPPGVSVPAGYRSHKVRQTYSVDVPDNEVIGCGPVPRRIRALKDLAPAPR